MRHIQQFRNLYKPLLGRNLPLLIRPQPLPWSSISVTFFIDNWHSY